MATGKRNMQTLRQGLVPGLPRLMGDRLCLDFVNSVEKLARDGPWEYLPSYDELALWGEHVGVLSPEAVAETRRWGTAHPQQAAALYETGMELRSTLTRIFTAIARQDTPDQADLRQLQAAFWQPEVELASEPGDQLFGWSWTASDRPVEELVWRVAASAVNTLTEDDLDRIKECTGTNDCGSLFYDTSRNGTRRWCSMEGCGSRAKMRRHYARTSQHES